MMPEISVIIPTYNRASVVKRAIRSVLNQTCPDFELIVVDDCSTDSTLEILSGIGDSRLRVIRHTVNRGGSAARNSGILSATGPYIAFQDSDDEWLPDKLEKQMSFLQSQGERVCGVFCGMERAGGAFLETFPMPDLKAVSKDWMKALLGNNFIGTPAVLMKREALVRVGGFDEMLPRYQDWDLWLRLAALYDWAGTAEISVRVHDQPDGISRNMAHAAQALEIILAKIGCPRPELRRALGRQYLRLSILRYKTGGHDKMVEAMKMAHCYLPFHPGVWAWALRQRLIRP